MHHKLGLVAALFVLLCSTSACATLAHGARQSVLISSDPPGAAIFVNGKPGGATPATLSVRRRQHTTVRLEREGYEPQQVELKRRGSHWLWLDLGICMNPLALQGVESGAQWLGVITSCAATLFGIDLLSGAAFAVQKDVNVQLTPIRPAR